MALIENGEVKKVYSVAVGKDTTPSPTGTFTIVNRLTNPTYYHKGLVIPQGPQNPIGNRWIGLSQKGYGIHGTNAPHSIGKAASHGCIRMGRKDWKSSSTWFAPATWSKFAPTATPRRQPSLEPPPSRWS